MALEKSTPAKGNYQFHWSSGDASKLYHPKRKDHFMVLIGGKTPGGCGTGFGIGGDRESVGVGSVPANTTDAGSMWYAKTVNKPTLSFGKSDQVWGDTFLTETGGVITDMSVVSLEPIKATLIDPVYPDSTRKLLKILRESGYEGGRISDTYSVMKAIGNVKIFQYTTTPQTGNSLILAEEWTLKAPMFTNITFGDLDYGSEDFVELSISFGYAAFSVKMYSLNGTEPEFEYFSDGSNRIAQSVIDSTPSGGGSGKGFFDPNGDCSAVPGGSGGGQGAAPSIAPGAPPATPTPVIAPPPGAQSGLVLPKNAAPVI